MGIIFIYGFPHSLHGITPSLQHFKISSYSCEKAQIKNENNVLENTECSRIVCQFWSDSALSQFSNSRIKKIKTVNTELGITLDHH